MLRTLCLALFTSFFFSCAPQAGAEELVFANDATPYCPYTLCPAGQGYVLDVLVAVFEGYGYRVKIENLPWNRAVAMAAAGQVDGIAGITKDVLPTLVYPHSEIARYTPAVFSMKANRWQYAGVSSLKQIRLGMVENYGNGEGNPELEHYLAGHPDNVTYIAADDAIAHLFLMIEAGHIDAMIEDRAVGDYMLRKRGKRALFKAVPVQKNYLPGYVGFCGDTTKAQRLAAQFDAGLGKLRRSGKLQAILARYRLRDWQQ
jgi:polar amino acid transport system substrate-binding protein